MEDIANPNPIPATIEFCGTCDLALWCKLLRDKGWTGPRIARTLGRSEGYVNNLIRVIERASPAVLLRWREEQSSGEPHVCATDWLVQVCLLPHDRQEVELARRIESTGHRSNGSTAQPINPLK